MRTSWNVALQVAALVVFLAVRLATPGWMIVILLISGIGIVAVTIPVVVSVPVLLRMRVLPPSLTAPFVTCAASLVLGALLLPELTDQDDFIPIAQLLGLDTADVPEAFYAAGFGLVLVHLGAVVWLVVAVVRHWHTSRPRPAGPHPAWIHQPDTH